MLLAQDFVTHHVIHNVANRVVRLVGIDVETIVPVHVETYALGALLFAILHVKLSVRMRPDTLV